MLKDQARTKSTEFAGLQSAWVAEVARTQNHAAYAQLFGHFAPRLRAYLRRLGADDAATEDLVQDVMSTVWQRAAQFDAARASAGTWIFSIARNRYIDMRRHRSSAALALADPSDAPAAPAKSVEDAFYLTELERHLRMLLKALPQAQTELIRRSFFEHQSQSTIARELDLPLGTVKSRQRLAIGKLRRMLSEVSP